jgi:hypothetical protein
MCDCRLRSTGMSQVDDFSSSLISRMASQPTTHDQMLKSHAVSHMMQDLARGSPMAQDAAVKGLASIANSPRIEGISVPGSPLKVHLTVLEPDILRIRAYSSL